MDESGIPKLLDFGISKLLLSHADFEETQGPAMLTPAYASPEQVIGEAVTTISDVYSLGVVLYELLTGMMAHRIERQTPLPLERAICLEPVAPPSAVVVDDPELGRRLQGDLDNIVLHAMQKQPERRYASVEQLAVDIQRHLDHLPVNAPAGSMDLA